MKQLREAARKSHERRLKSFGGTTANRDFGGNDQNSPMVSAAQGDTDDVPVISPDQMGNLSPLGAMKKGGFVHG
jgi:hypothetical protein